MGYTAQWDSEHQLGTDHRFRSATRSPLDPIVVFLDPALVRKAASVDPFEYEIKAEKLRNVAEMIDADGLFYPPIVMWYGNRLQFVNGRHRSEFCAAKGLPSVPYVTANHMASPLLAVAAGSQSAAEGQFDMSAFSHLRSMSTIL